MLTVVLLIRPIFNGCTLNKTYNLEWPLFLALTQHPQHPQHL